MAWLSYTRGVHGHTCGLPNLTKCRGSFLVPKEKQTTRSSTSQALWAKIRDILLVFKWFQAKIDIDINARKVGVRKTLMVLNERREGKLSFATDRLSEVGNRQSYKLWLSKITLKKHAFSPPHFFTFFKQFLMPIFD